MSGLVDEFNLNKVCKQNLKLASLILQTTMTGVPWEI